MSKSLGQLLVGEQFEQAVRSVFAKEDVLVPPGFGLLQTTCAGTTRNPFEP